MTSLPDPERRFKFGNLTKNAIFQQKRTLFITYWNKYQHLFINNNNNNDRLTAFDPGQPG